MSKAVSSVVKAPIRDPGFDSPEARQRKRYMVELFGYQAPKYDFHDDVIGLGIHRWWARDIIKEVRNFMQGRSSARMLDLACGTGFVIFNVAKRFNNIDIDGFDISPEMVAVARKRHQKDFKGRKIELWVGDAELPCGEGRYDIVTTCFAFRNFANKSIAVDNVFKALKPGGVFIIQDMTKPERQPFRATYLFALKYLLPVVAKILGTEKGAARYLYNSVQSMPRNTEIKVLLESTGFVGVSCKGQTMGMGCIFVGNKPGV
jgi:demethylmenaquinone methyltransferase/2-methoxy-6-polyprenyl-1,4-benzoquinol methylase